MLTSVGLNGIRLRQRYVSPRKGLACVHCVRTGGGRCSSFAFRSIERHGMTRGLKFLRRRPDSCGIPAESATPDLHVPRPLHAKLDPST